MEVGFEEGWTPRPAGAGETSRNTHTMQYSVATVWRPGRTALIYLVLVLVLMLMLMSRGRC
jgi:hypothetical protein